MKPKKVMLIVLLCASAAFGQLTAKVVSGKAKASPMGIMLKWTTGAGGGPVSGFVMLRATVAGGPYVAICGGSGQPTCPTSAVLSYLDLSSTGNLLLQGQTYYYVFKATGPGGESPNSNEVSALWPFLSPSAPVAVSAIPQ